MAWLEEEKIIFYSEDAHVQLGRSTPLFSWFGTVRLLCVRKRFASNEEVERAVNEYFHNPSTLSLPGRNTDFAETLD